MFKKKAKALYTTFKAPLPQSPGRERLRMEIGRMLTLLREAMGNGMPEKLGEVLRSLAQNSGKIEKAIIAWVRLIEVLVQQTERGSRGGAGELKKADVKAAMHYILSSDRFEIPGIPTYLRPIVIDLAVDWSIDMIVTNANQYDLWIPDPPEPETIYSRFCNLIRRLKQITRPFWERIAELFARLYVALRYLEPLSPELRTALEQVEQEGLIVSKQQLLRDGIDTVIFIGTHGSQVIALSRLVFEAVREAELFVQLSGPEKKQYARDLILTVLNELGFPVDSGLIGAIIQASVDAAIESAVDIFNRRAPEMFSHS